jgi:hypothetical protein
MNERIKELYKQALENKFDYSGGVGVKPGEYYSNYKTVLNAEKFALLIAQECADLCDRFQARDVGMQPAECAGAIRQHFGVLK